MRVTVLMVLVVQAVAIGPAAADGVVLESYAGDRPGDADRLLRPLLDELGLRGFTGRAALVRRLEGAMSSQARLLTSEQVGELRRLVSSGVDQFREGQYDGAVRDLIKALALIDKAPVTLVQTPDLRDKMLDALVFLATAYTRQGKSAEATRIMAELIRSFPDKEISNARHGPEPRRLYDKVQGDLDSQGQGKLRVTVDDPRTVVFVNERYAGAGSIELSGLAPGRYRVFVQQGTAAGRLHRVDVEAGTEAVVSVAWNLDSALFTDGDLVALRFAGDADRGDAEAALANRVARAAGADGVVAIGIREVQGRRSIVGTYLSVDSTRPLRSAALAVDPVSPGEDKVRALGRFLAGDEAARKEFPDLLAGGGGRAGGGGGGDGGDRAGGGHHPYRTWKWALTVTGVAAAATGGILIAIDQPDEINGVRNPDARATKVPGIITAAGGGVLIAAGIYCWVKDAGGGRSDRSVTLLPTRGGGLLTLAGRF